MNTTQRTKHYLFHSWSHKHPLHRTLVKLANRGLRTVPISLKYLFSRKIRATRFPYALVMEGNCVVQIGAPADTLHSGRSRGMGLTLCTGSSGRSIVIEPEPRSCREFRAAASTLGVKNVEVLNYAVTDTPQELVLRVNPLHPATNFIEGRAGYTAEEVSRFDAHPIEGRPLETLLREAGLAQTETIKVLSITTNGAEKEILRGATDVLPRVEHIALAGIDRNLYEGFMADLGFEFVSFDDRGITYRNTRFEGRRA